VHALAAKRLGLPRLALERDEAEDVAAALAQMQELTGLAVGDSPLLAWAAIIWTLVSVYGTRILDLAADRRAAAEARARRAQPSPEAMAGSAAPSPAQTATAPPGAPPGGLGLPLPPVLRPPAAAPAPGARQAPPIVTVPDMLNTGRAGELLAVLPGMPVVSPEEHQGAL
jgi:hypothetical protein